MMILVILLASIVILGISILCVRTILLTSLEKDKRQIGMMKAIGISRADIRNLYFFKFAILSVLGAVLGEVSALLVSVPLCKQMREQYGLPEHMTGIWLLSVVGVLAVEAMILLSVHRTLRCTERMTAVDALRGTGGADKKEEPVSLCVGHNRGSGWADADSSKYRQHLGFPTFCQLYGRRKQPDSH